MNWLKDWLYRWLVEDEIDRVYAELNDLRTLVAEAWSEIAALKIERDESKTP